MNKENWLERDLDLRPPDWRAGLYQLSYLALHWRSPYFVNIFVRGQKKSRIPLWCIPYCRFPGCIVTWAWSLAKAQYMVSWLLTGAPEQRYWQHQETANVGLDSSVGRAPARRAPARRAPVAGSSPALVNFLCSSEFIINVPSQFPLVFIAWYFYFYFFLPSDWYRGRHNNCADVRQMRLSQFTEFPVVWHHVWLEGTASHLWGLPGVGVEASSL